MTKSARKTLAAAIAVLATCHSTLLLAAETTTLYVAPKGNDGWSGKLETPNSDGTDGPLATPQGARNVLRKLRGSSGLSGPASVLFRGGVYQLSEPWVFEPQDSGTEESPVTFAAYPQEHPILSGGRVISGFRSNGPLWEVTIPEVAQGKWYFRQLFINGQRRTPARSPNTGFFRIAELLPGPKDSQGKAIARDKFVFHPGDVKPCERLEDVSLTLMHSWETSFHPLKSIDATTNTVTFAPLREWWSVGYWEPAQRYYLENAREFLDAPGEWFLNRRTGVLSYWPMPGENPDKAEAVAPALNELVRIEGKPEDNRFVDHVTLRGISFQHSDWQMGPEGWSSTQAAVNVPAAIIADGARYCAIEQCEVTHIGTYGIWLRHGAKQCRVQQNRLFDLGAGGVRVGEDHMAATDAAESTDNLVDNNHIRDGGRVFAAGVGIWVAQSSGNRISHNDIHDLSYSGMSIGWNWGREPNRTRDNIIEFNHVHNLVHGVLSDAGLIYTLGVSPGSVIRNNIFHDIWPYSNPPFGWGIYLDAHCGDYLVENNLVYNTLSGGLMYNNGGHAHTIRNNIFARSANVALWPYSDKKPSTFRNNIVYLTQGSLLVPYGEQSLQERLAAKESPGDWDQNIYWHTAGPDKLRFYDRSFADWQALGLDRNSQIADPRFADAAQLDFRLEGSSPAIAAGFRPFDLNSAGLYGDESWKRECSHSQCAAVELPAPPPPPAPLTVNDDMESTVVGNPPAQAIVDGETHGASIRVTDETASQGKHSLKITDSKSLEPSWQPHFFYQPHYRSGQVFESFDVKMLEGNEFFTEWRDAGKYPGNIGPSVQFSVQRGISVAGKTLCTAPIGRWFHVEIQAQIGSQSERRFQLSVQFEGEPKKVFNDLPFSGGEFRELEWLGFSSTAAAETAFYLDNLKITQ
jgi:hypothetical protein